MQPYLDQVHQQNPLGVALLADLQDHSGGGWRESGSVSVAHGWGAREVGLGTRGTSQFFFDKSSTLTLLRTCACRLAASAVIAPSRTIFVTISSVCTAGT